MIPSSGSLPRALVLTAGIGQRLRPLSFTRAKPAVPIAGEALIRRILRWLSSSGVERAVLNLHYRPESIARLVGDGSDLGLQVRYSWEQPLLGSAGGPRRALDLLDAPRFMMINGDTLTNVDLQAMTSAHARSGARVTMALVANPAPDRYGGVRVRDDGTVAGFTRPGDRVPSFHFVGVQLVEADVFAPLPAGQRLESVNGMYRTLLADDPGAIRAFVCGADFQDVGTPSDYLATCLRVAQEEGLATLPHGSNARVPDTATIVRSVIWDDVDVGPRAHLHESIVGDRVHVPAGARFERVAIAAADGRAPAAGERREGDLLIAPLDPARLARVDPSRPKGK